MPLTHAAHASNASSLALILSVVAREPLGSELKPKIGHVEIPPRGSCQPNWPAISFRQGTQAKPDAPRSRCAPGARPRSRAGRARVRCSRRSASKPGPIEPALVVAVARRLAAIMAPAGPGATRIAAGLRGFRAGRLEPRSSAGLPPCVTAPPRYSPPPLLPVHRSCGSSRRKGFQAREPAPLPRPSGALTSLWQFVRA